MPESLTGNARDRYRWGGPPPSAKCNGMTTACQPIFATPRPLLIAGVREVLTAAGITAEPRVVGLEGLATALARADQYLVCLDGEALPHRETLAHLCGSHPGSHFVLWTVRTTTDLLRTALDCGIHGLLSTRLPLEEASSAVRRICRGERILRFDPDTGPAAFSRPLRLSARERHVLMVLAGGATNGEIAAALRTTANTVKGCLSRMFRKTGARNRRELVQLSGSLLPPGEQPRKAAACSFDALWMLENL